MRLHSVHDVSRLIRDRRTAAGLSQAALAARIGTSRQWVVALEGGRSTNVELAPVLRAFRLLGLELDVLLRTPQPSLSEAGRGDQVDAPDTRRRIPRARVAGRPPAGTAQAGGHAAAARQEIGAGPPAPRQPLPAAVESAAAPTSLDQLFDRLRPR